ncbi:MAG TPA: hypothetical protein DEB40_09815 [Elusimicrobia bacterium]|nr:hypothetical protein [Elusimicrobiota bacterium]HBT62026.1 hypothetical protein [Elusimicrobiota bacterium]
MAKLFPEFIQLKKLKCPSCGESLHSAELRQVETVVHAACRGQGCAYSVELFWLGSALVSAN